MAIETTKLVQNLAAKAGNEGPQIVLSWEEPEDDFDEFQVFRKLGNFPQAPGDGKLVYKGRTPFFADLIVKPLAIHYYTVFTLDTSGGFHFSEVTQQKSLAYVTGHFHQKILELLPSAMLRDDRKDPTILREQEAEADGEKFNFRETTEELAQLNRLAKLISLEFDRIKALIDFLPTTIDVDQTDIDFLAQLAFQLGIDPEYAIPFPQRRDELKNIVNVYKFKGTKASLIRLCRSITGHQIAIHETARNAADAGAILPNLSSLVLAFHFKTPYDRVIRAGSTGVPRVYGAEKFILFVVKGSKELTVPAMSKAINRAVPQFSPAPTTATFVVMKLRTTDHNITSSHSASAI